MSIFCYGGDGERKRIETKCWNIQISVFFGVGIFFLDGIYREVSPIERKMNILSN